LVKKSLFQKEVCCCKDIIREVISMKRGIVVQTVLFLLAVSYLAHLFSVAVRLGIPCDVEYRWDCLVWQIVSLSALILMFSLNIKKEV